MANDTTGSVWKLDTTGTISTGQVHVKQIRWTPAAAGNDILIEDNGGGDVWAYKALTGNSDQSIEYYIEIDGYLNGFILTTLDAGTVYVHIK